MRQLANGLRFQTQWLAGGIDDCEIVPGTLHFGEFDFHEA